MSSAPVFVLEGSVRKGGSKIRISLQVVGAHTGTHLWAETFDRNLEDTDMFEVQDEITDRVASTVADPHGVVVRTMAASTASKSPDALTPYETILRFFLHQQTVQPAEHRVARGALERAVEIRPDYADAWAALAITVLDEYRHASIRAPIPWSGHWRPPNGAWRSIPPIRCATSPSPGPPFPRRPRVLPVGGGTRDPPEPPRRQYHGLPGDSDGIRRGVGVRPQRALEQLEAIAAIAGPASYLRFSIHPGLDSLHGAAALDGTQGQLRALGRGAVM